MYFNKKQIQDKLWKDWIWQLKNRITTLDELVELGVPDVRLKDVSGVIRKYPFAITPYYASLINFNDQNDPIARMVMPDLVELDSYNGQINPLDKGNKVLTKGLEQKHDYSVILKVSEDCASKCRFCARKDASDGFALAKIEIDAASKYLRQHPKIWDVLLSGGDPLLQSDEKLWYILGNLRDISSVKRIRIGTRVPATLPYRITDSLLKVLSSYYPAYIQTHFNHPNEFTKDAIDSIRRLVKKGNILQNQTILLNGVNDDPKVMIDLSEKLIQNGIRPYYVFQCAEGRSISHFRVDNYRGNKIMSALNRDTLPGDARAIYAALTQYGNLRKGEEIS